MEKKLRKIEATSCYLKDGLHTKLEKHASYSTRKKENPKEKFLEGKQMGIKCTGEDVAKEMQ